MSALQVLMPMGGLGQRFRDAGVATPKPLITARGRFLYERALDSLAGYPPHRRIFVIRAETDLEFGLADKLRLEDPDARVVVFEGNTRGAVETCLVARDEIDGEAGLVIMDCDIAFESEEHRRLLRNSLENGWPDGLLVSFSSSSPRYSYAEVDTEGRVLRTAEKQPISDHALVGAYAVRRAHDFFLAADAVIERGLGDGVPEFYVSAVIEELVRRGADFRSTRGKFWSFGTPEELENYENTGLPI